MAVLERGLVQVYTGAGKGKTTAALGLAWRMLGRGGRVYVCQFLKPASQPTGEALLAEQMGERLRFERLAATWDMGKAEDGEQRRRMAAALRAKWPELEEVLREGRYDLVILDEMVLCVHLGLVSLGEVERLLAGRARHVEVVLTGRGADEGLRGRADLVTVMEEVKHPHREGAGARLGIEL